MSGALPAGRIAGTIAVVDTNVWSKLFVPNTRTSPVILQVAPWRGELTGITVVIATQTRAEILYGMERAGWGVMRRSGLKLSSVGGGDCDPGERGGNFGLR